MIDTRHVETLLQDAIALLEESGFPMAADALRDNLRGIRTAPTGGARRRRLFQLRDVFEGSGPGPEVFRATQRYHEERFRRTLDAIQELLAAGISDDESEVTAWTPAAARVA